MISQNSLWKAMNTSIRCHTGRACIISRSFPISSSTCSHTSTRTLSSTTPWSSRQKFRLPGSSNSKRKTIEIGTSVSCWSFSKMMECFGMMTDLSITLRGPSSSGGFSSFTCRTKSYSSSYRGSKRIWYMHVLAICCSKRCSSHRLAERIWLASSLCCISLLVELSLKTMTIHSIRRNHLFKTLSHACRKNSWSLRRITISNRIRDKVAGLSETQRKGLERHSNQVNLIPWVK